ncbi:hypothetical protein GCM10025791_49730 [Halioxenophilus aromaticivorans]|uniref:Uncharacterized protein n=1 Tax=Halioxenophilus aromaticivorans TaxID=1306992 RepID=A0AAV3UAF3_9ALTE
MSGVKKNGTSLFRTTHQIITGRKHFPAMLDPYAAFFLRTSNNQISPNTGSKNSGNTATVWKDSTEA